MHRRIFRFLPVLLLSLLFLTPAHAEIVGQTLTDDYIHRVVADNGQTLYFVSSEEAPVLYYEDVNFDGLNDAVVLTTRGASNFFYQCFLSDGAQYVFCPLRLCNYNLDAEHKIVTSFEDGGLAGGLHTTLLYRFDGITPVLLREAKGAEKEAWSFDTQGYTVQRYNNMLTLMVWAYSPDGEATCVFEQDVSTEDETALTAALQAEENALWADLR